MKNLRNIMNRSGSNTVGFIVIIIGLAILLKNFDFLPWWLYQWHTFLILIGFYVGTRSHFRSSTWLVMVLIGTYFTLDAAFSNFDDLNIAFPIMLLIYGLYLVIRPKYKNVPPLNLANAGDTNPDESQNSTAENIVTSTSADYVTAINVFGASQQIVYSKNVKGGELTSIFGGGDVNFSQADFEGEIIINVATIFGGVKLIIPPSWQIKSELVAVFGGVEDKRGVLPLDQNPNKTVVLKGFVLFGGLEVKSF